MGMEGRGRGAEIVDGPPASWVETRSGTGFEAGSWEAIMVVWVTADGGVDGRKGNWVVAGGQVWFLVHCEG